MLILLRDGAACVLGNLLGAGERRRVRTTQATTINADLLAFIQS